MKYVLQTTLFAFCLALVGCTKPGQTDTLGEFTGSNHPNSYPELQYDIQAEAYEQIEDQWQ